MTNVVNLHGAALWMPCGTVFGDRGARATRPVNAAAACCAAARSAGIQTYCRKARDSFVHRIPAPASSRAAVMQTGKGGYSGAAQDELDAKNL
jgi:hypothetical protein